MNLKGLKKLKTDLPCFGVGNLKGLVVVAANPGWNLKTNPKEEAHCSRSADLYIEFMRKFYSQYPRVIGTSSQWWSKAMNYQDFMKEGPGNWSEFKPWQVKWRRTSKCDFLGGWDLFPFHSNQDGISTQIKSNPVVRELALESFNALIRIKPRAILIAHTEGYDFVTKKHQDEWAIGKAGTGPKEIAIGLMFNDDMPIMALRRQVFSGRARKPGYALIRDELIRLSHGRLALF